MPKYKISSILDSDRRIQAKKNSSVKQLQSKINTHHNNMKVNSVSLMTLRFKTTYTKIVIERMTAALNFETS